VLWAEERLCHSKGKNLGGYSRRAAFCTFPKGEGGGRRDDAGYAGWREGYGFVDAGKLTTGEGNRKKICLLREKRRGWGIVYEKEYRKRVGGDRGQKGGRNENLLNLSFLCS